MCALTEVRESYLLALLRYHTSLYKDCVLLHRMRSLIEVRESYLLALAGL